MKQTLLAVLLIAVVLGVRWGVEQAMHSLAPPAAPSQTDAVTSYSQSFALRVTDRHGQTDYRLSGARLARRQDSRVADIEQPVVIVSQSDRSDWTMQARRGSSQPEDLGDWLRLQGAVHAERLATPRKARLTLNTAELDFFTGTEILRTPKPVRLASEGWVLHGRRLEGTIAEPIVLELFDVRGRYEPSPKLFHEHCTTVAKQCHPGAGIGSPSSRRN